MSDRPFVPFYTSDFLAGTSGMTAATKGVYITLLSLMYEAEAPLPQSWETLARRSGCTMPSFKKAIEALQDDAKITITDAGIWSDKCDKHITQRRERSDSAKAAAKKRWGKDKGKQGRADATAYPAQCKPEPEPEPYSKKEEPKGSKKTPPLFSLFPSTVSEEVAKAFVEMRAKMRKPLTPHAVKLIGGTIAKCEALGFSADDCLNLAIEKGWQSINPEWVQREMSGDGGNVSARRETYGDEARRVLGGGPDAMPGDFLEQPNVYQISRVCG